MVPHLTSSVRYVPISCAPSSQPDSLYDDDANVQGRGSRTVSGK